MSLAEQEPYHISERFYLAIQAKALDLERNAHQDELRAFTLTDAGHVERQNSLVQAQRTEAQRLRSFLADARIRVT